MPAALLAKKRCGRENGQGKIRPNDAGAALSAVIKKEMRTT
jgi:hypothetical protein